MAVCRWCKAQGHSIEHCPTVLAALAPGYGPLMHEEGESDEDFRKRRAAKGIKSRRGYTGVSAQTFKEKT